MSHTDALQFDPQNAPRAGRLARRGGRLEQTLVDELPDGGERRYDVVLHYEWDDYDPADEPFAQWGARIVGLELRGVQSIDSTAPPGDAAQLAAAAWNLVEEDREALEEHATLCGYEAGIGEAGPLASLRFAPRSANASPCTGSLAPSARVRMKIDLRKFG